MKLKSLIVCVAVLAVASVAAYFANRPKTHRASDPRVGTHLVDSATVAKAAKIVLTSDEGQSVTLARQPDGTWRVSSYYDLPGDFSKISQFVSDLNTATVVRFVTVNPERIERLEFKGSRIRFLDDGGREIWSMDVGKATDDANGRFVRFGSDPKVYLTGLNLWMDTEAKNWADSKLLTISADDVAKIEIPLDSGGPVTFSRKSKSDSWTASPDEKRKVKPDAVNSALSSLCTLRFSDTTAPSDPAAIEAAKHDKTYVLTTFSGHAYSVSIGRKPEEKKLKAPVADAKSGPASLGKIADLKDENKTEAAANAAKPAQPEYETIPAGPWFVSVHASETRAPVNAMMKKRSFQVDDYSVNGLPKTLDDLFEPAPAPPTAAAPSHK